jgi:uncharacterized ferritin-like protein (DUF455 family)
VVEQRENAPTGRFSGHTDGLLQAAFCACSWPEKLFAARAAAHDILQLAELECTQAPRLDEAVSEAAQPPHLQPRALPVDFSSLSLPSSLLPEFPGREAHTRIVAPDAMPRRKSPLDPLGLVELLHALAQIELAAIEIDSAQLWLYPHAPTGWQKDMARIILDECRHFELLEDRLEQWGVPYGSLPVHHGLWKGFRCGLTWLEHLALTVRYQEANGVDASYALVCKAESAQKHTRLYQIRDLLRTLHGDEIRHVAIGSRWWNWAFAQGRVGKRQQERDEEACTRYFEVIEARVPRPWARRFPFYIEGRRQAGFSEQELSQFESLQDGKDAADRKNAFASQNGRTEQTQTGLI